MAKERHVLNIDRDIERKFKIGKLEVEIKSRWSVTVGVIRDETPGQLQPPIEDPIKLIETSTDEVTAAPVEESTKVKVSR